MIGLIIWALLIIFIGVCVNPTMPIILIALFAVAFAVCYIGHRLSIRKILKELDAMTDPDETNGDNFDREAQIDAWERKWGRTHPTRINRTK